MIMSRLRMMRAQKQKQEAEKKAVKSEKKVKPAKKPEIGNAPNSSKSS